MILSAYSVTTEPRGIAVCAWPATSLASAERCARTLSERFAEDPRYPNAFWVIDPSTEKPLGKWWHGQRYNATHTI